MLAHGLAAVLLSACGPFDPRSEPPTPTAVLTPTATLSPTATVVPSPMPTPVFSPTPTATPVPTPTASPSLTPTPVPTAIPTAIPTAEIPEAALVGDWEGTARVLGTDIPVGVTFQLENGELLGTLDIDSQEIKDLAFTAELFPDGRVRFVIPDREPPIAFDGMLEDGVIAGSFAVGIIRGSFVLERAAPAE